MQPVRITCSLAGPVADYAPALDALLIEVACRRLRVPRERIPDRHRPAPHPCDVPPIPLDRGEMGGWPIYCVSAPIVPLARERVAHFGKRIDTSRAALLAPEERRTVVTTNTWTKSYRLPIRALDMSRIVWFAVGDVSGLRDLLGDVHHVGRKAAHGWGRTREWQITTEDKDQSWYAECPETGRPILMRALPLCPELPADLDGWRADYGACCPPYWHVGRFCEIVVPC